MLRSIFLITFIAFSFNAICNAEFERAIELLEKNFDQLEGWEVRDILKAERKYTLGVGEKWVLSVNFWNTEKRKLYNLGIDIQVYDDIKFTEGKLYFRI